MVLPSFTVAVAAQPGLADSTIQTMSVKKMEKSRFRDRMRSRCLALISYHILMSALCQLEFVIGLCRHLVTPGAVGGRAAAIARDDRLLLALDVAIDPGHPRIDLVGE